MTMEEGTVRQLETTDVTHEEESDDEDEVDLVMKRLKRLVKVGLFHMSARIHGTHTMLSGCNHREKASYHILA